MARMGQNVRWSSFTGSESAVGYVVVLMPVEVDSNGFAAKAVYARKPHAAH